MYMQDEDKGMEHYFQFLTCAHWLTMVPWWRQGTLWEGWVGIGAIGFEVLMTSGWCCPGDITKHMGLELNARAKFGSHWHQRVTEAMEWRLSQNGENKWTPTRNPSSADFLGKVFNQGLFKYIKIYLKPVDGTSVSCVPILDLHSQCYHLVRALMLLIWVTTVFS